MVYIYVCCSSPVLHVHVIETVQKRHAAGSWDSPTKDHQLVFVEGGAVAPSVESASTEALNTMIDWY